MDFVHVLYYSFLWSFWFLCFVSVSVSVKSLILLICSFVSWFLVFLLSSCCVLIIISLIIFCWFWLLVWSFAVGCSVQDISLSRRMGCTSSISKRYSIGRKKKLNIPEILVFTPTLRIPANSDLVRPLRGHVSQEIVEKLFAFRSRILLLAEQCSKICKAFWISFSSLFYFIYLFYVFGWIVAVRSAFSELHQALQEYLPFLLALTKKGMEIPVISYFWNGS